MFELRDLNNNVIDSWTSSDVPYGLTRIMEGKYTLVEVNVFTTGNKEYVKDELFVFKLRDSYINRMSDNDYLKYNNSKIDIDNIPKYLLLNGTEDDYT